MTNTLQRIELTIPGHAAPATRMTRRAVHVEGHRDAGRIRRHLAWKAAVGWEAKQRLQQLGWTPRHDDEYPFPRTARLYAHIWFYFHAWPEGTDLENIQKLTIDGLNGVLFRDDQQIRRIFVTERRTTGEERAEVIIGIIGKDDDFAGVPARLAS